MLPVTESVLCNVAALEALNVVVIRPPLCVVAPVNIDVLEARTLPKEPVDATIVEFVAPTPPMPTETVGAPTNNAVVDDVTKLNVPAVDVMSPPLTAISPEAKKFDPVTLPAKEVEPPAAPAVIVVAAPPMLSVVAVVLKTLTVEAPAIRVDEVSVVESVSLTDSFPLPLAPAVLSNVNNEVPPNVLLSLNCTLVFDPPGEVVAVDVIVTAPFEADVI